MAGFKAQGDSAVRSVVPGGLEQRSSRRASAGGHQARRRAPLGRGERSAGGRRRACGRVGCFAGRRAGRRAAGVFWGAWPIRQPGIAWSGGFSLGCLVPAHRMWQPPAGASAASVVSVSRHGVTRPGRRRCLRRLDPRPAAIYGRYNVIGHGISRGRKRPPAGGLASRGWLPVRPLRRPVGTPADLASRLRNVAHDAHLSGLILSSTVPDPLTHIRLLGTDLQTLLNGPHAGHTSARRRCTLAGALPGVRVLGPRFAACQRCLPGAVGRWPR